MSLAQSIMMYSSSLFYFTNSLNPKEIQFTVKKAQSNVWHLYKQFIGSKTDVNGATMNNYLKQQLIKLLSKRII